MSEEEVVLTGSLQENVLMLLCFSKEYSSMVSSMITPSLFEDRVYQTIAERSRNFIDKYHEPPGQVHLPDIIEDKLSSKDKREASIFSKALHDLNYTVKEGYRPEYILSTLRKFVRQQKLKVGVTEAARLLQEGNLDGCEDAFLSTLKTRDEVFDKGLALTDVDLVLNEISKPDAAFKTGIEGLDSAYIGPARKELYLFMAPINRGKSWHLINLGKYALLARKKVLYITLEMSQAKTSARFLQALFSLMKRPLLKEGKNNAYKGKLLVPRFKKEEGAYKGIVFDKVTRPALLSASGKRLVRKRIVSQKLGTRYQLIVKEFPTGMLTVKQLNAYLDLLERHVQFVPDLMIIDYADLMEIGGKDFRIDTGKIYQQLRGIGVERDMAVASATQSNRMAEDARWITLKHIAEDYSKAATADDVVTYSQTIFEKKYGLARLFIAKGRDEASGLNFLISQSYGMGQFAMDSSLLSPYYWEDLEKFKKEGKV